MIVGSRVCVFGGVVIFGLWDFDVLEVGLSLELVGGLVVKSAITYEYDFCVVFIWFDASVCDVFTILTEIGFDEFECGFEVCGFVGWLE